uniref:Uncharacterized protein n=1 Tax=Zea mays TaxID=4577 RepID=A0A804NT49_MAIZE
MELGSSPHGRASGPPSTAPSLPAGSPFLLSPSSLGPPSSSHGVPCPSSSHGVPCPSSSHGRATTQSSGSSFHGWRLDFRAPSHGALPLLSFPGTTPFLLSSAQGTPISLLHGCPAATLFSPSAPASSTPPAHSPSRSSSRAPLFPSTPKHPLLSPMPCIFPPWKAAGSMPPRPLLLPSSPQNSSRSEPAVVHGEQPPPPDAQELFSLLGTAPLIHSPGSAAALPFVLHSPRRVSSLSCSLRSPIRDAVETRVVDVALRALPIRRNAEPCGQSMRLSPDSFRLNPCD